MVPHLRGFRRISLLVLVSLVVTLLPPGTPGGSARTTTAVAATPAVSPVPPTVVPPVDFVPTPARAAALLPPAIPAALAPAQSPPPETSLATGKPATASSEDTWDGTTWVAGNANDGDPNTYWESDWQEGLPQWWQVDFEDVYTVTKVVIDWGGWSNLDALAYTIAVSDDGVTFTDVVSRDYHAATRSWPTNDANQTIDTFTARGRYLRFTVTSGTYDCSGPCSLDSIGIAELRAYGMPVLPDDQSNPPERCPCDAQEQTNDPVNTHTGAFWISQTDLHLASPGPALAWTRTYNSRNVTATTILGPGWQHPYATRLITETMPGGEDGLVIIMTPKGNRFRFADNGDGTFRTFPGIYDTLVQGQGVYTQTLRDQSQYVFAAGNGRLISMRDPQDRTLTLSYDPTDGRLLQIADTLAPQRALVLGYNATGDRITSISDGTRSITYGYDANGDLTSVTDPMSRTTTYTYWEHLLTRITNPLGQVVEEIHYWQHMDAWRVWYQQLQDGRYLNFEYRAEATVVQTWSDGWNELLEEQIISYGPDSTRTGKQVNGTAIAAGDYDAQFAPGRRTDGNGNTTTTAYNAVGQPLTITDALGQRVQAAYDDRQRPTVITDTLGRRTELAYDDANNLIRQTSDITGTFPGFTTVFTYNVRYPGQHWLEETVGPDGVRMHYEYDALGQRTAVTRNYEDGVYADTAPDQDLRSTYGYDSLGRVVTTTVGVGTPLERMDVTDYNADDTVARTIRNYQDGVFDPATPDADIITTYGYDNLGRQVWVQDVLGRADVTHYDAAGRMDWTTRNLTPFQVDADGLPVVQPFDPAQPDRNVTTQYGYDALGRTTLVTETGILTGTFDPATRSFSAATERVTRTEYDDLSRPVTVTLNYRPGVPAGPDVNVATTRQYDPAGNLVWDTDALGRWTHTDYDALNRPITVTLNYENGDPLTVDAANSAWATITDTDILQVTHYTPDGQIDRTISNYVDGVFDPADPTQDRITVPVYDALGRTIQTIANYDDGDPATGGTDTDLITETVYDAAGRVQARRDPLGHYTSQVYDTSGRVVSTIQNCRDSSGVPVPTGCAAFDPAVPDRNIPVTTRYDALGRSYATVNALGQVTQTAFDPLGRAVATTQNYVDGSFDPATPDEDITTRQAYDELGRTTVMTDALGMATSFSYDGLGRQTSRTDPEQRTTTMGYDGSGGMRRQETPDGRVTVMLVDGLGRVTSTIQHYGDGLVASDEPVDQDLISRTVYDVAGRRVATIDPGGRETRFSYDLRDNLIAVTENATDGTCATAPCNVVTQYAYDRAGNRIQVIDARGITTQQAGYDAADRQVSLTDGSGHTTTTSYDRLGRMTGTDDPRGPDNDLTYSYDELSRPTSISATNLDAPISMAYDALGRRTGLTDGTGTTSFTHDALGRITGITAPDTGSIGYAYNARGQRTGLTYPDGTNVTYTYHADGQLHQVIQGSATLATYAYDSAGRRESLTRANGAVTSYAYDNADRLTDLQTSVGVTATSRFQYTLDRMGRRTVITETLLPAAPNPAPTPTPDPYPAPTTEAAPPRPVIPQTRTISYTYDGLQRLTGAAETPGTTYASTYDLAGNRTEVREDGAPVANLSYNDANQVIGWSYDAAGNLLSDGTSSRSYDALSRLVAQAGTNYTYNGDGVLVSDGTTTYAQDLAAPLSQVLTDGTANYLYGHDRLRAQGGPWYIGDALGSVRQTLDDAGAVVGSVQYDPWGVPTAGTPQPFGFTGELHSAGQVYLRARWYTPGQGRFVSEDPFAGFAERPYSLHAYQYGYSNPLRWTDPTGENPLGVGGVSAACLAFIAGDGPFPFGDAVCVALLIALGLGVTTLPLTSTNRTLVGPDVPTTCDPFETFIDSLPQTALDPSPEHQPKPTIVPPAPVPVPAPTPDDEEDECEQSTYHYGALETFDSADPKRKRATGARARLCIPLGKGTKFQKGRNGTHIEGFISGVHDRAHLIARELGGRGIQANGIPVFPSSNQYGSRWRQIEEMVKRAVDNGDTVVYKVTPIYNDSNGPNSVPISISVVASGRTIAINEVVPNIP